MNKLQFSPVIMQIPFLILGLTIPRNSKAMERSNRACHGGAVKLKDFVHTCEFCKIFSNFFFGGQLPPPCPPPCSPSLTPPSERMAMGEEMDKNFVSLFKISGGGQLGAPMLPPLVPSLKENQFK